MGKVELLAPAGSPETLRAVLAAGADAVYVGGDRFGARAYAKNFTGEELLHAIDYTHLHGKKLHLTINTLLKNRELEEQLYDYLLPFYERGLDAVIVQDAGVFSFIRHHFPGMELHASTQMSVAGAEGARFWKHAGADRIVLARELSVAEIRQIHESVDVELECFAHGALCYCYSGQCLFSSMLGGRSGNRGRCAQPCRLPYGVMEEKRTLTEGEIYPLSPKDLGAASLLPELLAAGVSSLKIEGRMKQTGYAAGVTAIYRKYLDLLDYAGAENYAIAESDRQKLLDLGNRSGFTDGYLRGEKGREMMSLHSPKHTGRQTEKAEACAGQKRRILGSCVCAAGRPALLSVTDLQTKRTVTVEGGGVEQAKNAPTLAADVEKVLRQTGETEFEFKTLDIRLDKGSFIPKQFLKAMRREALQRLAEELLFAHRRDGWALPQEDFPGAGPLENTAEPDGSRLFAVCDTFEQLRVCAGKDYIETLALQLHSFQEHELGGALEDAAGLCRDSGKKLVFALPEVLRSETAGVYERQWTCMEKLRENNMLEGFLAKSYDCLGFLQRMGVPEEHVLLDSSIYAFSDRATEFFRSMGYRGWTLPLELNAGELRRHETGGSMLVIYGHAAFMVSSQCIHKNISGCDRVQKMLYLSDRCKKRLPVKNYCGVCCNIIYNALPTLLFGTGLSEIRKIRPQKLRMDFTVEDAASTEAVLAAYERHLPRGDRDICGQHAPGGDDICGQHASKRDDICGRHAPNRDGACGQNFPGGGKGVRMFDGETTRGHFKRGVE